MTRFSGSTRVASVLLAAIAIGALALSQAATPKPAPPIRYAAGKLLEFPADYREWIFLSSGRGMTYGPSADPNGPPNFDNVFVNPAGYREFLKTGQWPDKTIFILELRRAATEGSINRGGSFQKDLIGIEVEVKDQKQFPDTGGWGYFEFNGDRKPAAPLPKNAGCIACHSANGAVDHTFVQFYPTLIEVAKAHGTLKK